MANESAGASATTRYGGTMPLTGRRISLGLEANPDNSCSGSEPLGACATAQAAAEAASDPLGTAVTVCSSFEPIPNCATAQAAAESHSEPLGTCAGGFEPLGCPAKSAIVQTSQGPRALFAAEYPDVWFFDIMQMTLEPKRANAPIDPMFLEVCEPGTIRVVSLAVDGPMSAFARIEPDNTITLRWGAWCMPGSEKMVYVATITLAGVRKGAMEMRFLAKTEEDMRKNADIWNQPHMGGQG